MAVEDDYEDVLQNIELGIISRYKINPQLCDREVMQVLEALITEYNAEALGKTVRKAPLGQEGQALRDSVRPLCEWRLGRVDLFQNAPAASHPAPITIDEIILCLKRIKKSVKHWHQKDGRQGYLRFIAKYVK